jgi:extradiol dioxygenase family protein
VDDLVAAERFYSEVFGGRIALSASGRPMRFGLTVAQRNYGQMPHTFFDIGGRRIGVYLQEKERPKPDSLHGAPTYSFAAATAKGFERVIEALRRLEVPFERTEDRFDGAAATLYFNDPAGNNFRIFVPVDADTDGGDPELAVSDLRIEAPDLDRSVQFYADVLGLDGARYGKERHSGAREAALGLPSGQTLFLTEVPFSPKGIDLSRNKPGPHLAFFVPPERWESLVDNLAARGIENGDRSPMFKGRTGEDRDTYLDEPSGHVIQLVSVAMHSQ